MVAVALLLGGGIWLGIPPLARALDPVGTAEQAFDGNHQGFRLLAPDRVEFDTRDPWGQRHFALRDANRDLQVSPPPDYASYQPWSAGPDRQRGTSDDVPLAGFACHESMPGKQFGLAVSTGGWRGWASAWRWAHPVGLGAALWLVWLHLALRQLREPRATFRQELLRSVFVAAPFVGVFMLLLRLTSRELLRLGSWLPFLVVPLPAALAVLVIVAAPLACLGLRWGRAPRGPGSAGATEPPDPGRGERGLPTGAGPAA